MYIDSRKSDALDTIIAAHYAEKLVVFIGAGVSRMCGAWGWDKLASELVEAVYSNISDNTFNYRMREHLLNNPNQKEVISTCYYLLDKAKRINIFWEIMRKALLYKKDGKKNKAKTEIYSHIAELGNYFVTTNADMLFDLPNRGRLIQIYDFLEDMKFERDKIYHIHGCINDEKSMVFTLAQYMERYRDFNFISFMRKVFEFGKEYSEYTVLFLGYGMVEMEILQFLFEGNKKGIQNRYLFKEFYEGEEKIIEASRIYYEQMNINVIPFYIDSIGYNQLNDELEFILGRLDMRLKKDVDNAVSNPNIENINSTLNIIKTHSAIKNYLFTHRLLSEANNNPQIWLKPLYDAGYFEPNDNPCSEVKIIDGVKHLSQGYWIVIQYLEYVANANEKKKGNSDDEITNILVEIITGIINYPNIDKRVYNFRTDWAVIRILACLPSNKIDKNMFDVFLKDIVNKSKSDLDIIIDLVPAFKNDEKLGFSLLDSILEFHFISFLNDPTEKDGFSSSEARFFVEKYHINKIKGEKGLVSRLININSKKVFDIIEKKIKKLINESSDSMEYVFSWAKKNRDHVAKTLIDIIKRVFLKLSKNDVIDIIFKRWLIEGNVNALKIIAIELIDENYNMYKDIFWQLSFNPLVLSGNQVSILFANHYKEINTGEREKAKKWIQNFPKVIRNYRDIVNEEYIPSQQNEFKKALNEGQVYRGAEITSGFVKQMPPDGLSKNDILKLSNEQLTKTINNAKFGRVSGLELKKTSTWGLGKVLKEVFQEKPKRLLNDYKPFFDLQDFTYFQYLFDALQEIIREDKAKLNPNEVILFLFDFVANIKNKSSEDIEKNLSSFIVLGRLLEKLFSSLSNVLDENIDNLIKELFLTLFPICPKKDSNMEHPGYILNNANTGLLSSSISYMGYHYEITNGEYVHNDEAIKNYLLNELMNPKNNDVFYVIGRYFVNLWVIDKEWVKTNYEFIFPNDDKNWFSTFTYLIWANSGFNKEVIELLIPQFERTVESFSFNENENLDFDFFGTITEIIAEFYMFHCDEEWTEPIVTLLPKIIKKAPPNVFSQLLWQLSSSDKKINSPKLEDLENLLLERFKYNESKESDDMFISLSIIHIKNFGLFSDNIKRLKQIFREFNEMDSHRVVKTLKEKLESNIESIKDIAEIYLAFVNVGNFSTWDNKAVLYMVEKFYEIEKPEIINIANEICRKYFDRGIYYLNDLWEKYGDKKSRPPF